MPGPVVPGSGRPDAPGARPDTVPGARSDTPPGESAVSAASSDPGAPAPLGVERRLTRDPAVDALLERLADVDHLPAEGHLEVYEDVHRGLRDALTALDARPGSAPAPVPPGRGPSYDHRR
ncbi:hypothetical protein ACFVIM_19005 [Streptomyces sp. NPDC057638]|uniref:hypothetical protein n=1 Tax=Streptomyces sp. NPDC057638 TaxID=3346190 RepID=UPI0036B35ED2